jgi:hypothetical protein
MPKQQKSSTAKILPRAAISGYALISPDGLTVSIHGIGGVGTPLLARLGKEQMYLPSAMIVNVPTFAKWVAWNGVKYSFHATKQAILAEESIMLIGRIEKEENKAPDVRASPAIPPSKSQDAAAEKAPPKYPRFPASIYSPSAARKMEAYMFAKGLDQTQFGIQANTTDKTIRKFRQTGKVKRSILADIAKAMKTSIDELLSL